MTDAPPTPALALVTEALREFGIKCASELNVTGTVLRFADEKAESAARALLQKLDALSPPDAIRAAEPVAVMHWYEANAVDGAMLVTELTPHGRLTLKHGDKLYASPPKDEGRVGEVVTARETFILNEQQSEPSCPFCAHYMHSGHSQGCVFTRLAPPSGAALRDASPAQGWRMVPVKMTNAMINACIARLHTDPPTIWSAMLDAAPPPPAGESN